MPCLAIEPLLLCKEEDVEANFRSQLGQFPCIDGKE